MQRREPIETVNPRRAHRSRAENPRASGPLLSHLTRLIISAAGILILFYFARSVVLPIMLAIVGWMVLKPPVAWLRTRKIPGPLGAAMVMGSLLSVIGFGLVHLERPIVEWVKTAPETLPRLKTKYQHIFAPISRMTTAVYGLGNVAAEEHAHLQGQGATNQPPKPLEVTHAGSHSNSNSSTNTVQAASPTPATTSTGGASDIAGTLFTWTGSILFGIVETTVLMFLLLASGDRFIEKCAAIMPTSRGEAVAIGQQIQRSISMYLFSVSLINIVLGALVGFSLQLVGMPNAAMWGVFAALVNFIPYFGPIVGIAIVTGAGLLAFDSVGRGLLPAGAYLVWHLLEADLITPILLGKRFRMSAFVIFVMLMFCGWLWGVLGALLAMPVLVSINVICSRVPRLAPVAEFLSA